MTKGGNGSVLGRTPVKVFRESLTCEECGGDVASAGVVLACHPPIYVHHCVDCGCRSEQRHYYPRIVYEDAHE